MAISYSSELFAIANPQIFILFYFFSGESVFARCLSALKDERVNASSQLEGPSSSKYTGDKAEFIEHIRKVQCFMCNRSSTILTLCRSSGF